VEILPRSVREWAQGGEFVVVEGERIFTRQLGDHGPTVVLLHGFPGSSHDWREVAGELAGQHRVVTMDLLGFGLSDKPAGARYSLYDQAELVERILVELGIVECVLVSHDMGDTVAAELLHRHTAGRSGLDIRQAIITNGSIFIDMAELTRGQRLLLALPDRRLPVRPPRWLLRRSLLDSFAPECRPTGEELDAMVALIRRGGGDRLLARQSRYLHERTRHQQRWTAALVDFPGPLAALWGQRDPIALPTMVDRLVRLRPDTTVIWWPDVSHWPSIEAPRLLADAISTQVSSR